MGNTRFDYEDDKSAEDSKQGKKKSKSSEKRKGSGTGRDKAFSQAAKKRNISQFKTYFDQEVLDPMSNERVPESWPSVDEDFIGYLTHKVEREDMPENQKERLRHVLQNCHGMKSAQVCWSIIKSFDKVPRNLKQGGYDKNDCPVCKAADGKIVDQRDHNCPYCRSCFDKSGWKQECTLLVDCNGKCQEGADVSITKGN